MVTQLSTITTITISAVDTRNSLPHWRVRINRCRGYTSSISRLPSRPPAIKDGKLPMSLKEYREHAEREYIVDTLSALDWNISKAAVALGVERTNLHKKIRGYGIKRGEA